MADFTEHKITQADLAGKGVEGLPDVPGLTVAEMQAKFDELVKEVVKEKYNALIDALNATDLEGHVIENSAGTDFAHRTKLAFSSNVLVVDDPENNRTYLTILPWSPTPEDLSAQSLTMLGYTKPESTSPIVAADNVSQAIGKLEKKADGIAENAEDILDLNSAVDDINVVHTFTIETTDWVANTDPNTSTDYPYVAVKTSTYYTADSRPTCQLYGATGGVPTLDEFTSIYMVRAIDFQAAGVTLYATDEPQSDLTLVAKGV